MAGVSRTKTTSEPRGGHGKQKSMTKCRHRCTLWGKILCCGKEVYPVPETTHRTRLSRVGTEGPPCPRCTSGTVYRRYTVGPRHRTLSNHKGWCRGLVTLVQRKPLGLRILRRGTPGLHDTQVCHFSLGHPIPQEQWERLPQHSRTPEPSTRNRSHPSPRPHEPSQVQSRPSTDSDERRTNPPTLGTWTSNVRVGRNPLHLLWCHSSPLSTVDVVLPCTWGTGCIPPECPFHRVHGPAPTSSSEDPPHPDLPPWPVCPHLTCRTLV